MLLNAGLRQFEYFADHCEPVIFRRVIRRRCKFFRTTLRAIEAAGLEVFSAATGRVSYLLNMLSHPYPDMRRGARAWMRSFTDLAAALGARYISGHYDCLSRPQMEIGLDAWLERSIAEIATASEYAAEKGLRAIFLEQMHRPQLQPNTIERARHMLDKINSISALPVHMHLDLGHMAHVKEDPAHTKRDKEPLEWLATPFGYNELLLVHLQQTDGRASRHWPFTPKYNAKGIISAAECIRAIERSGVKEAVLALEIFFARGTRLELIEPAIVKSAAYWRGALKRAGYTERNGMYTKGL